MKRCIVKACSKGIFPIYMITIATMAALMLTGQVSYAQEDPIGRILKDGLKTAPGIPGTPKRPLTGPGEVSDGNKVIPSCPDGWDCAYAGRVIKGSYKKASVQINVAAATADRDYDRISLRQTIGETHGVIVNTIKVGKPGSWKTYNQGMRLPEGRTAFDIPVPAGTAEIVLSLDHGKGARLRVVLERRLP
jgi:hypothetical protein